MKKRFRFQDYKGKYVMHCKTEDEAIAFCKFMHEDGRKWWTEDSYLDDFKWSENEELTCYNFNIGDFDSLSCYKFFNFLILEYSDFNWSEQFTKSDLQDFDFVVLRCGKTLCVNTNFNILFSRDGDLTQLENYRDDLTDIDIKDFDIMKVYRPNSPVQCCFDNYRQGNFIYERGETLFMKEGNLLIGRNIKIER